MATIITKPELPVTLQTADLIDAMIAGANASASRVAPCLTTTASAWAATTAYAVGAKVKLTGANEYLEATAAGTSAAAAPTAPDLGATVTDGTVTWKRIGPTPDQWAEAKLILFGMIKRWIEAGSGAVQTQSAGPFGLTVDTRQKSSGFRPWPSEVTDLQAICNTDGANDAKAFSVDMIGDSTIHADICALNFGATYCSCGADIAGYPLYEG